MKTREKREYSKTNELTKPNREVKRKSTKKSKRVKIGKGNEREIFERKKKFKYRNTKSKKIKI
jgi:hypothetical protein